MVKGANRKSKNRFGRFAYLFSAIASLKQISTVRYDLRIDGQEDTVEGVTCIIANAGNVGFTDVSLDRHIDVSDGLLDIIVVRKANLSLLKLIVLALFRGERPDNVELVKHWQGKDITVSVSPKQMAQYDGEVLENIPSHIKVIPAVIKVLVPQRKGHNLSPAILCSCIGDARMGEGLARHSSVIARNPTRPFDLSRRPSPFPGSPANNPR